MRRATPMASPGLGWTLAVRLVIATMVAMVMQAVIVSVRDYFNETDFLNNYVRREANAIARSLGPTTAGRNPASLPSPPEQYTGEHKAAYAFRVVEADGGVISEHNSARLAPLVPWTVRPSERQDFWVRKLESEARMYVAGGLRIRRPAGDIWVEVATFGDPAATYLHNIALDFLDDVWVPALPLVLLSILVAATSVRRSLRPLVDAANQADAISALERRDRIDVRGLPAEAAHFASAVNRLLDRVTDLVAAHRLFIARAAHELRTPLSIMMLEVVHLKEADGKRFEADLVAMSEIVDQLLTLSRLQTIEKPAMEAVDISTVARELVARLSAWAEKDGHRLLFNSRGAGLVLGHEPTLRDALRNLIENAVKHTPHGTTIQVSIEHSDIIVEDSGPGLGAQSPEDLQQPFRKGATSGGGAGLGLAIVRQAAEIHGGGLEIGASGLGGARFALRLPAAQNAEAVLLARPPATRML